MIEFLKKLFGFEKNQHQTHYVAFCRGDPIITGSSKSEVEQAVRNLFENVDAKMQNDGNISNFTHTSKHKRWKNFKGSIVIKELCQTCGYQKGYCGQC